MAKTVEVTRMHRLKPNGNNMTKAYCDILLGGKLTIKGVRIVEGPKGFFMSLPQKRGKDKDGKEKWYSIIYVNDKELYEKIQDEVLTAYNTIE